MEVLEEIYWLTIEEINEKIKNKEKITTTSFSEGPISSEYVIKIFGFRGPLIYLYPRYPRFPRYPCFRV